MVQNPKADTQDTDSISDIEEAATTLQDLTNQPRDKPASEPTSSSRKTPRALTIDKKDKSTVITQLLKILSKDPNIADKYRQTITDAKSTGSFRTRWDTWNNATKDTPLASSMHEQTNGSINVYPSLYTNSSYQKIFERFKPKLKGKSKTNKQADNDVELKPPPTYPYEKQKDDSTNTTSTESTNDIFTTWIENLNNKGETISYDLAQQLTESKQQIQEEASESKQ